MKKKGFSAEQIIGKLRETEVLLNQGSTVGEVSRKLGITEKTHTDGGETQETGGRSSPGQCNS